MYKSLIVDDEMIVRVGLKSFIEWEKYGFTLCGEANNGEEALALCERIQPDLVLTDIKMPKMDGIMFIEQALKRWPEMKVIVLSCVNEFDVLQQAFRFGVKDYFLKLSFNPDHLISILERMREELNRRPNHGRTSSVLQEPPYPEQAVLKENFYRIAVRDKHHTLRPDQEMKLRIGAGEHVIMYISGDHPYNMQQNDPKLRGHLLKLSVINIIEEVLDREVPTDVVELEEDAYLAVLHVSGNWSGETAALLATEIQHSLLRFLNYSVSIGISTQMDCFQHFYPCYAQTVTALEQKFYRGHGSIHFYSKAAVRFEHGSNPLSSLVDDNTMASDLDSFSFEKVRTSVIACIEEVKSDGICPSGEFKSFFIELVVPWLRMYKRYGGTMKDAHDRPVSPFDQIYDLETLEDIKHWYLDFTVRMEEMIRQLSKGVRSREEIEKAKRFVEKHYAQDISIVDIAKHIGLNSTYFSHLFKKENREGFSEYLTRYRLNQAQRLLRDTPKNISEISEEVGYNDVAYFRKIFRQQLQMTPSEYRGQFTET